MAGPEPPTTRRGAPPRSNRAPTTVALVVTGPLGRAEIPTLCERVRVLTTSSPAELVICEVGRLDGADLGTVDALARVTLVARRLGRRFLLGGAPPELRELLSLTGLTDVVPCVPGSAGKPQR